MRGGPLSAGFEGIICDLDGVVYAGAVAVEHAVDALNRLAVPVVYATNNASRPPSDVADHLRRLGVRVEEARVLTSSVAAARELATDLPAGTAVLAVGGPGVGVALRDAGLRPLAPGDEGEVAAVLQGYGPQVTAADLGEAAHAIRAGARWVVTNDDLTLPTERGPAPGNGSLVGAVRNAVDRDPEVIGKPHPPMYELAADVLGVPPARVLAIGDRLETDMAGAQAAGTSGALVLTGVHGPVELAAAPFDHRPQYVLTDLRDLAEDYPEAGVDDGWHVRGSARARLARGGRLEVVGAGADLLRAALDALWTARDAGLITAQDAGRLVPNG